MKNVIKTVALLGVIILTFPLASFAQKDQKIKASYWYVFGRYPNSGELNYWNGQPEQSLRQYVDLHKNYLAGNYNTRVEVIQRAYKDAFGRAATSGEVNYWEPYKQTYTQLVTAHVNWLRGNTSEREATIKRSYQRVFARQPSGDELAYWKKYNLAYITLLGCHEAYRRTNQTSNLELKSSSLVNMQPIAGIVVNELASLDPSLLLKGRGKGSLLLPAANLIGNDAGSLVGPDGASLVGPDGGTLVAAGAGN